ncbi:flagella basal body P-ring formation protein FlgA [Thermovibrio guaymasensis]|uniref:Flagella basal body P-ring formation protein FlgA n=1 Tax=Thermovibrio guaymasensis TaxID=240167 RepID=A0A420W7G3_9BACT|nr:flagella basal body P-ring formation protein FlgA [Thermovibrio guaymasensis]
MKCSERLLALRLNLFFFVLFLFFPSLVSFAAEVLVKEEATVGGNRVFLSDVAEIKGNPLELEILRKVPISSSPQPCRSLTISKKEIAEKIVLYLKENRVSFKEIEVKGAPYVKVRRNCTVVGGERIKRLIEEFLKRNYPQLVLISVPTPSFKLPVKEFKDEVSLKSLGRNYARFVYKVYSNGELVKKVWLTAKVDRKVKVVTAKTPIPKGSLIRPDMVEFREIPSRQARGALSDLKNVVGKVANRDFLPGEVFKSRDLKPNFIVRKGKPVKVVYIRGPIHIELLGIALENGAVGNIIRVKNISTGKILRCRVEKDGSVTFLSD